MEHEVVDNFLKNINNSSIKINTYLAKFMKKNLSNNRFIRIPEGTSSNFFEQTRTYLFDIYINNKEYKKFDPTSTKEETIEWVMKSDVDRTWELLLKMINSNNDTKYGRELINKKENTDFYPQANLSVVEAMYNKKLYYIVTIQYPIDKIFKGKSVYKGNEGKITKEPAKGLFVYSFKPDFIITEEDEKSKVYIINKKNFKDFFDYDLYLKDIAKKNIEKIKNLEFIKNADEIEKNIETKYVYQRISKIVSDNNYLVQMEKVNPKEFKDRLLKNSSDKFTENDFDECNKIILNKSNLNVFLKAIAKEFKYNFFTGGAENI